MQQILGRLAELETIGVVVPGIENVGPDGSPSTTQLRYFPDEEKFEAQRLENLLKQTGLSVRLEQPSGDLSGIRPRHYEVWFARQALDMKKRRKGPL